MKIHRPRLLAAFALFFTLPALALEGTGYGADAEEARRRAAADLAAAIQVRVKSVVESCTAIHNQRAEDCGSRVLNLSATDLPLLGLTYREIPGGGEPAGAVAALTGDKSGVLYAERMSALEAEFAGAADALKNTADRKTRHALLSQQVGALRALADHRLVATALGMAVKPAPASEAGLLAELAALEDSADTLAFAARLLLKDVQGRLPEVAPVALAGSRVPTPLGEALAAALRVEMSGRNGPSLRALGEYRLRADGDAEVLLELRDAYSGERVATRGVRLAKAAFAGLRAEALAPDFNQLLVSGEAVSGELRADLFTTFGNRQLSFKDKDTVKLLARLSRAGYFYIVGYVDQPAHNGAPGARFSYLLPLQELPGRPEAEAAPERFIRHVPADKANHYLEIGEFEVAAPFGVEHLQIIASTEPPEKALPQARFDAASGYYRIGEGGNLIQNLNGVRALRPIPSTRVEVAESTLSFITAPR